VSIIIVHYRTTELLATCLETLAAHRPSSAHEILIVDNAPADEAAAQRVAALAARHGARHLLQQRNLGYAGGVNVGLRVARGRYYLILNPDIEVRPGAIDRLAEFLDAHPAVGLCGPKLFSPDGSLQYSARTNYTLKVILLRRTPLGKLFPRARALREHLMMDWDHNDARDVDWMLGGAVMARRAAVEEVGEMDARYFLYFEDVDWCERMRGRGWRVVYVPQAEMVHAHRRLSARGFLGPSQRMHIESALRFYEKWSLLLYLGKQHARALRALATLLLDLVLLSAAFFGAYFTRYLLGLLIPGWAEAKPVLALGVYSRFVLFADLVAVAMFYFLRLYRSEVWHDRWREFLQLVKGIGITSLVVLATTFLFTRRPLSRFTIVLFFPYALLLVELGRALLRRLVAGARERKLYLRRIAIFGPPERLAELRARFARHGTFGYEPVYLAHDDERRRSHPGGHDPIQRRLRLLAHERIAEVVVFDGEGEDAELIARLMPPLRATRLPLRFVPRADAQLRGGRGLTDFMGFAAVALGGRVSPVGGWLKRLADLVGAGLLLGVGWPLHLVQLLAAGRPRLRRENWIGRHGAAISVPFYARDTVWLRALPLLRWYPALSRVVAGELSFTGPTPLTPEQWAAAEPAERADPPPCAPGLLSPLTAAGLDPSGVPIEEILTRNRGYVEQWSPSEDLRILLETAFRAMTRKRGEPRTGERGEPITRKREEQM
ncbi:MAG: glycosyltransferase, partial [Candidatus Eisenbacteria bacterium]|nr:glycosyltransferase [Candidatus Eisenbacteria bacterium]